MSINLSNVTKFFQLLEKQVNPETLTGVLSQKDTQTAYSKLLNKSPELIPQEIKSKFGDQVSSGLFQAVDSLGVQDNRINAQELYASLDVDPTFSPWTANADISETPLITGDVGPYETSDFQSGNYGRNAALNAQNVVPDELSTTDIRYTPKDTIVIADVLGYAEQDIKQFDQDADGALSQTEVRAAFGGGEDTEISDTLFKAIDTDGDSQISNVEQAAYILFQDYAAGPLDSAIGANEEVGFLTAKQAAELRDNIATTVPADTQADGLISAEERAFADGILLSAPTLASQVLQAFQDFISTKA